mgnify:CR=1 FL=1
MKLVENVKVNKIVVENGRAVAVKGGRVVAVGAATEIDRQYAAREVVNAGGNNAIYVFALPQ